MKYGFVGHRFTFVRSDTDILSKHFVCFQDMSSRYVLKTSSRRFQHNNFSSSKTSSRRLQDQDLLKDEKLLCWMCVEEVFKTCLENVLKTSWRPANVCWVHMWPQLVNEVSTWFLWLHRIEWAWEFLLLIFHCSTK